METKTQNPPFTGTPNTPMAVYRDSGCDTPKEAQTLPVASSLRKLKVGDKVVFPIEQRSTVLNTLSRFRSDYMRQGWDAEAVTNKQDFTVVVTRTN